MLFSFLCLYCPLQFVCYFLFSWLMRFVNSNTYTHKISIEFVNFSVYFCINCEQEKNCNSIRKPNTLSILNHKQRAIQKQSIFSLLVSCSCFYFRFRYHNPLPLQFSLFYIENWFSKNKRRSVVWYFGRWFV